MSDDTAWLIVLLAALVNGWSWGYWMGEREERKRRSPRTTVADFNPDWDKPSLHEEETVSRPAKSVRVKP